MMFRLATASHGLGWSPSDFWRATPREFWAAVDEGQEHADRMEAARQQGS